MTQATHLHPGTAVAGYPRLVLAAFRDLIDEIQADPDLAAVTGMTMDSQRALFAIPGTGGRTSALYGAIADLVVVATRAAREKGARA